MLSDSLSTKPSKHGGRGASGVGLAGDWLTGRTRTHPREHRRIKDGLEEPLPQKITVSSKALVDAAKRAIEEIEAADAVKLHGRDDVVLVDLRDPRELERDGRVPGAFRMTRGMLEFWIDPDSVYFKPIFAEDKRFVFFCAGGLRSALAAKTAQDMGLKPVAHVLGGFKAWKEAGGPTEPGEGKK